MALSVAVQEVIHLRQMLKEVMLEQQSPMPTCSRSPCDEPSSTDIKMQCVYFQVQVHADSQSVDGDKVVSDRRKTSVVLEVRDLSDGALAAVGVCWASALQSDSRQCLGTTVLVHETAVVYKQAGWNLAQILCLFSKQLAGSRWKARTRKRRIYCGSRMAADQISPASSSEPHRAPPALFVGRASFFEEIYESANSSLFQNHFRMGKAAFDTLCRLCSPRLRLRTQCSKEVFAVTLDWLGRAASVRDQEAKFNMAYSTVHRFRRHGLHAIVKVLGAGIRLPQTTAPEFAATRPFFEGAVVAIEWAHFPITVAREGSEHFRNRKGWTSTNVLIVADWRANVGGLFVGAEGSTHDSIVLDASGLLEVVPEGRFTRRRRVCALTKAAHAVPRRPISSSVDSAPSECRLSASFVAAKTIIVACACLHNFLRDKSPRDVAGDIGEECSQSSLEFLEAEEVAFDFGSAKNWSDWIATAMWSEYENEPQRTV
ncbi:hypothetical protein PybrP1_007233 [[Pythium] brassicae (nom. inval.)]|nr:hypothetical protein PybrP1_007233 [[Pythium] brassicae (nom. inval.)]